MQTSRETSLLQAALESAFRGVDPWSLLDRLARGGVVRQLAGVKGGELILRDPGGASRFGRPSDLHAMVHVHRRRFFRKALLGGTLSIAESYIRGDWDCDDLTSLFRIFVRDSRCAERFDAGWVRLAGLGRRLYHALRANSRRGSRRNIAAHYDLGNDFYRLWLDETMAYSSGVFSTPHATLQEASVEKFDRVCRKLELSPADHLLEIGAGWGGFALHAAARYGCKVSTTTISKEQAKFARRRLADAGLTGQATVLEQDYRDLVGRFDKLASIEMIEAVGRRYMDQYFAQCGRLLKPDGTFVLQAIVMPERGYDAYLKSVDFIQRYVFPGGCLPSLAAVLESVGRTTDLRFVHAEDFGPHYAETLRRWRRAFFERIDEVRALGYSTEFIRLWDYYLCYCEAAFEERYIGVLQVQFDKPHRRRDPIELGRNAVGARSAADSNARVGERQS